MNAKTCNHKRCKKPAVVGFRPFEGGYDVTKQKGVQYRCALHGKGFIGAYGTFPVGSAEPA